MYLVLIFSDDGRSWILTRNGKAAVEDAIRPVDLNKETTQRLEDFPQLEFPGKGVYFYRLSDRAMFRAPAPAMRWQEVLQSVASEQA